MALYKFKKEKEKLTRVDSSGLKPTPISSDYIYVKSNSKLVKVQNANILFIEALKDYVIIHTDKERFTIHSTMKDIEKKLPDVMFMRIHRSFILNLNKINSIDSTIVNIENSDKKIPIGGSHREGLFKRLNLA